MTDLQILGAGLGRTGTNSLKTALEILGFGPCHHMFELQANPSMARQWVEVVVNREQPDWNRLFDGYRSQVDWPGAYYWRELAACYPRARVILTTREAKAWYASMHSTLLPFNQLARVKGGQQRKQLSRMSEVFLEPFRHSEQQALDAYQLHNEQVISTLAPDRLLVFNVADGWQPLCAFLDADIPDLPFPHTNSSAEFMVGAVKHLNK